MKWTALILLAVLLIAGLLARDRIRVGTQFVQAQVEGKKSVRDRMEEYGATVEKRLAPRFAQVGLSYPPRGLTLLAIKSDRRLELYGHDREGRSVLVCTYPILAASGRLGPKLREGDRQVPEGVYAVESLNPNSLYHLSLRLNYPNEFDRQMGLADKRDNLGGDIMIHGSNLSIGCLAMGDPTAEDLFVLTALVGKENVRVIVAPLDFRTTNQPVPGPESPAWLPQLYDQIKKSMRDLPTRAAAPL